MKLTKVQSDRKIGINVFRDDDGVEISEVITEQEYLDLVRPSREGYTWKNSYLTDGFPSPSGLLEDGQYTDLGDCFLVKLSGCLPSHVQKDKIMDDELDDSIASSIQTDGGDVIKYYGYSL